MKYTFWVFYHLGNPKRQKYIMTLIVRKLGKKHTPKLEEIDRIFDNFASTSVEIFLNLDTQDFIHITPNAHEEGDSSPSSKNRHLPI